MLRFENLDGFEKLGEKAQNLLKTASECGDARDAAASVFRDWSEYDYRVKMYGKVVDEKAFDKIAQDYMEDFFKLFSPKNAHEKAKTFKYSEYNEKYMESLSDYVNKSKTYKDAVKKAKKAVYHDPAYTHTLGETLKSEAKGAKFGFNKLKALYDDKKGISKFKKCVPIGICIAGAAFAGYKLYQYIANNFKADEIIEPNSDNECNVIKNDTINSAINDIAIKQHDSVKIELPEDFFYQFQGLTFKQSTKNPKEAESSETAKTEVSDKAVLSTAEENKIAQTDEPSKEPLESVSESEDKLVEKEKAQKAFDGAINKIRQQISIDGLESVNYVVAYGDSFWRIAKKVLESNGVESPDNKRIVKMIALLAELNNIDSVTGYKLRPNYIILVPSCDSINSPQKPEGDDVNTENTVDEKASGSVSFDSIFDSESIDEMDFDGIYREFLKASR